MKTAFRSWHGWAVPQKPGPAETAEPGRVSQFVTLRTHSGQHSPSPFEQLATVTGFVTLLVPPASVAVSVTL